MERNIRYLSSLCQDVHLRFICLQKFQILQPCVVLKNGSAVYPLYCRIFQNMFNFFYFVLQWKSQKGHILCLTGEMFNHPNGSDVYHGVPKDYTCTHVNPKVFLQVREYKGLLYTCTHVNPKVFLQVRE